MARSYVVCAHSRARLSCSSGSVGAQSHGLVSKPGLLMSAVSGACKRREPRLICLAACLELGLECVSTCDCRPLTRHRLPESESARQAPPFTEHPSNHTRLTEGRAHPFTYSLTRAYKVFFGSEHVHMWRAGGSFGTDHQLSLSLSLKQCRNIQVTFLSNGGARMFIMLKSFTFHYQAYANGA